MPAGHDADASLETVDLNDDEVNLDHTPLLSQDQVQDLEAFLGHGGDDDDLLGVYGRDDQRSRASGTISDSKSIDSVDSIVVSVEIELEPAFFCCVLERELSFNDKS